MDEGARLAIYDPKVKAEQIDEDLKGVSQGQEERGKGSHAQMPPHARTHAYVRF
jgi:hypothetical protein